MIEEKNPQLMQVTYVPPRRNKQTGEKIQERFDVVYKDKNGDLHLVEEPAMAEIWFVKPQFRDRDYNLPSEKLERCFPVRVPFSKIKERIAQEIGEEGELFMSQCYQRKDFKSLSKLLGWPFAYKCDFQPEFYYMQDWYKKYKIDNPQLSLAFMDIEIDQIDYSVDLANLSISAYAPVNLVTVVLDKTKDVYTFILKPFTPPKDSDERRVEMYEKQKKDYEWLVTHQQDFINDLHKEFNPVYGDLNYHLRFYDKEIDLIADVFRLINTKKPDFCLMWNMRFDIQYLYHRIQVLGYDPVSVICHTDFNDPKCYFKEDKSTFEIKKQVDEFICSSYTKYLCQMRTYGAIRKSGHELKSYSLNSIGDSELGQHKVSYEEDGNIITFPYNNFVKFVKYNIIDSVLQYAIEQRTHDMMTYYMRSHEYLTPYEKIFKETHLLRNAREKFFEEAGWVQGNNLNFLESEEDKVFYGRGGSDEEGGSSYEGAINANPIYNSPVGIEILGEKSRHLFRNGIDFDMSAFYPSIKISSNMDPNTLLYKARLVNDEFESGEIPNNSLNTKYTKLDKNKKEQPLDFTGEALQTVLSGNYMTAAYNYMAIPPVTTIANMVAHKLRKEGSSGKDK